MTLPAEVIDPFAKFVYVWRTSGGKLLPSLLIKIDPVGAELFHVDGRTGGQMTNLIVAIRNFVDAHKTALYTHILTYAGNMLCVPYEAG